MTMLYGLRRSTALACLAVAISSSVVTASWAKGLEAVKLAGAYYLDSRAFSTASIGLSSDALPGGLSLWGFTDLHGDHDSRDLGLSRSFSEYRLSHGSASNLFNTSGFAFQAELNSMTGSGNDLVRVGLTYKHELPLPWGKGTEGWLQWRAFPYETDNDGGQASLIFSLPINPRLQIKGFADYNIMEHANNRWVIEPELNIRISERFTALLEFRYNEFEDANPAIHGSGMAAGIRYHFTP